MTQALETNLQIFEQRFEEIKNSGLSNYLKSIRLSALMTDMETVYDIPIVGHERIDAFARAYPDIIKLYREISFARPM